MFFIAILNRISLALFITFLLTFVVYIRYVFLPNSVQQYKNIML